MRENDNHIFRRAFRKLSNIRLLIPSQFLPIFLFSIAVALYDFLFLFYFRPFEFYTSDIGRLKYSLGFAVVSGLSLLISFLGQRPSQATLYIELKGAELFWFMISVQFFMTTTNWLYSRLLGPEIIKSYSYYECFGFVALISILPTTATFVVSQIIILKSSLTRRNEKSDEADIVIFKENLSMHALVQLHSTRGEGSISFHFQEFICALSDENYSKIFLLKDGQTMKIHMRVTLSSVTRQLASFQIIRCHKTAIINPAYIIKVSGNSKARKVHLKYLENIEIPVSRKMTALAVL